LVIGNLNLSLNPRISHVPVFKSEILISNNNLRNILLKEKHHTTINEKIMAISNIKQYNVKE